MFKNNQTLTVVAKLPIGQNTEPIIEALAIIASGLSAKELTALAHIVKNDPIKLAMAKPFLGIK